MITTSNNHNPPIKKELHKIGNSNVYVLNDGVLAYSTKQRAYQYILNMKCNDINTIYTTAVPYGYGVLSFSWMCQKAGIKAIVVISYSLTRTTDTKALKRAIDLGLNVIYTSRKQSKIYYTNPIKNIPSNEPQYSSFIDSVNSSSNSDDVEELDNSNICSLLAESDYHSKHLKYGMSSKEFIKELSLSLIESLRNIEPPKHLWIACESASTIKAIASIWPNTFYHCVRVGKKIGALSFNHEIVETGLKLTQNVDIEVPFSTIIYYDAKAWLAMVNYSKENDVSEHCMWNAGSAL